MENSNEIPPIAVVGILLALLDDNEEEEILEQTEIVQKVASGALIAKRSMKVKNVVYPKQSKHMLDMIGKGRVWQ
jgi:hypothetical protein